MSERLRFGILGTGNIAGQFATDVAGAARSEVVAVGSRTAESAAGFGERFGLDAAHCHGSYEALLADDTVEAIYLSLPNHLHCEWTVKAVEAGKHVLCEKPFAMDIDEAERMFAAGRASGRVVMEAFMYRRHPLTVAVLEAVRSGAIGELRMIRTSFCYRTKKIDGNVRFDPAIGGGALMDIGCYCLSYSRTFADAEPEDFHIVGHLHETGVDDYAAGSMRFPNGVVATFTCGMTTQLDNTAILGGTDGYLEVPIPWKPPVKEAQYVLAGQRPPKMDAPGQAAPAAPPREVVTVDSPVPLYANESDAMAAVVRDGAPLPVTSEHTLGNMRLLQAMRKQLGLSW